MIFCFIGQNKQSEEWSNRTEEKAPNKMYGINEAQLRGIGGTWCSACSLQLSSKIVAISHYQGKHLFKLLKKLLILLFKII